MILLNESDVLHKLELYFKTGNVTRLIKLLNHVADSNMNFDFSKIPNLKFKISNSLKVALETSVMSSDFSTFFNILDITNRLRLFRKEFSSLQKKQKIFPKHSHVFLENLKLIFSNIDQDFIDYVMDDIPLIALDLINSRISEYSGSRVSIANLKHYVENVFYAYTLRTRKVASFDEYKRIYEENKKPYDEEFVSLELKMDFQENFSFDPISFLEFEETHVIDEALFQSIVDLRQQGIVYDYPIISLVTSGGVGPQGKGFAYLTPMDDVVEICSDLSQNKAYILKFKEFLKSIFLTHLEKKLKEEILAPEAIENLIDFLQDNLQLEYININHYEFIIEKIEDYLDQNDLKLKDRDDFLKYVKMSLLSILAPVKLEDQFKLRMKLIHDNKLRLTDICKLVSLGNVSHFDILNQRQFFIHMLDRLTKIKLED
ncbi:MAG: hypothetical protein EAX96_01980 [Candidatus Lokiarchaeota archaeon]|nr:hypothetical protein [Candidatus Lokiarchaeota archaeon]